MKQVWINQKGYEVEDEVAGRFQVLEDMVEKVTRNYKDFQLNTTDMIIGGLREEIKKYQSEIEYLKKENIRLLKEVLEK